MNGQYMNRNVRVCVFAFAFIVSSARYSIAELFGPFTAINAGTTGGTCVAAGDIDGDGDLDIVVSGTAPARVGWYRNDGLGNVWSSYISIDAVNWQCSTVFVKDFDLDGDLDIFGGRTSNGQCYASCWKNSGNGTSWTRIDTAIGTGGPVHWVEPADINADGKVDIAYAQYNQVGWVEGTGASGGFGALTLLEAHSSAPQYRCAHPAQLDADAPLEITTTAYYGVIGNPFAPIYNQHVVVWGLTTTGPPTSSSKTVISTYTLNPLPGAWHAWDLDFDGDGDKDLAVCSMGAGGTKIWTNSAGSLTFHSQVTGATSIRSGYFSNSSPNRQSLVTGGEYRILNWTGTTWDTTTVATFTGNNSESGLSLGDFNLDGKVDFAGPVSSNTIIQWWRAP